MTTIYTADLQELLQCPLVGCGETLYMPTTLDCGHAVCKSHVKDQNCPVPTCAEELLNEQIVPRPLRIQIPSGSRVDFDPMPPEPQTSHLDGPEEPKLNKNLVEILAFLDEQDDIGDALKPKTIFSSQLRAKLTCQICRELLYNPITTPCQHTFCARCLRRHLFNGNSCARGCRSRFGGFAFWEEHPIDSLMQNLLLNFFADESAQRAQASITMDQDDFTPLFIVSLVLPGQECGFQIFEPRYRTMLRRCLEHHHKPQSTSGFPTMGLMMHTAAYSTTAQYGCIVDILEVQMMYDGRAILQVRGTTPFRVLEDTGNRDGYSVARVELLHDIPPPSRTSPTPRTRPRLFEPAERAHVRDLVQICVAFLSSLRRHGAPGQDVLDRIMRVYGAPPVNDPGLLGFWFARFLPVGDAEKARMLAIRSPRDRLERVIHWISRVAGPEPE